MNAAFPAQISAGDRAQKKKEVFFLHNNLRIDRSRCGAYIHNTSNEIPADDLSL
jgi:hypothetical protein